MTALDTAGGQPGSCVAPGVHMTFADSRLVVLDVFRDRYFRVDRERTKALLRVVDTPAASSVWEVLRSRGLTHDRGRLDIENPWKLALGHKPMQASHLVSVLGSCRWAATVLKRRSFSNVVRSVQTFRTANDHLERVLAAAQTFLVHRPLYPRDYACMFEALAMLRYLAVRGLSATWMFGVRGAPFSAHCWLERDGVVLNDDPDVVAAFKIVMGV